MLYLKIVQFRKSKKNMTENKEKTIESDLNISPEDMMKVGLHFGHKTSKLHPKMSSYLFGTRNSVHIFDLEKTAEKLRDSIRFVQNLVKEGKVVLFVGTKIQTKDMLKEIAVECGLPYVNERWLGGTFTNFGMMRKRIDYFKDLEKKKETGELEKYTKKERSKFDKELQNLQERFGGIKDMDKLPDAIFVLDLGKDALAVKEAKAKGIIVIGISDTNVNPDTADLFIPANDDAASAVRYILEKIKEAILKVKPKA